MVPLFMGREDWREPHFDGEVGYLLGIDEYTELFEYFRRHYAHFFQI